MTLETRVRDLAIDIATEINTLRTERGSLAALSTTDKSSIVAAINEVVAAVASGSSIDDLVTGLTTTWSSTKINSEIATAVANVVGAAPAALDTLQELAAALQSNDGDIASILTDLGNRVRTDTAAQGLTGAQQANARTNIGAQDSVSIGNTDRDFVADFRGAIV